MVKYVDSGEGPGSTDKKKMKRLGFKVDRRANFEKLMKKKLGKDGGKQAPATPQRVKSIVFDESSLKEYVTSLHKKKNERRVKAFVDMKRKVKKDSAKVRREQREEARRAYNQFAKVPILPNYTFRLPNEGEELTPLDDEELEDEEEPLNAVLKPFIQRKSAEKATTLQESTVHRMPVSMTCGTSDTPEEDEASAVTLKKKKPKKEATCESGEEGKQGSQQKPKKGSKEELTRAPKSTLMDFYNEAEAAAPAVIVEVRPLFASASSSSNAKKEKKGPSASASLPSTDFSDLPAVVEEELKRLRQETKGPSRTKAKIHTLKELEKIRKIKRHSRKGHGKKTSCGKRKNRK